ncbi:MAG TPA: hypothetical protein VK943_04750, partial [Arenibaculum sp.]|nr:hypothetical protein [Arenibaculum sp.]
MSDEVVQALRGILSRLATLALEDEALRTGLRQFAQAIIQLDQPAAGLPAEPAPAEPPVVAEVVEAPAAEQPPLENGASEAHPPEPKPERLPPLTLGRVRT